LTVFIYRFSNLGWRWVFYINCFAMVPVFLILIFWKDEDIEALKREDADE
jgi:MFS family permease